MAIAAKPKKSLEQVTTLKGTGTSAAEASGAALSLGAVADDIETAPSARSQAVFLRDELQAAVAAGDKAKRETIAAAATAFASANV
jgi:hypothetical protein